MLDIFSESAEKNNEKKSIGVPLGKDHDDIDSTNDLFNLESFLLHCCLDEVGIKGIQKAFYVISQGSSGHCSIDELYKV